MRRESESLTKNEYEWNIPNQLPKKNAKIWIGTEGKEPPREAIVTGIKGKEDFSAVDPKTKIVYEINVKKNYWSLEKPLNTRTPNNSSIFDQASSTPATAPVTPQEVSRGGILKVLGKK